MKSNFCFAAACLCASLFLLQSCASADKLSTKGWSSYRSGEYGKAEKKFSKALDKKSYHPGALEGMAFVSSRQGNYSSAERYMGKLYGQQKNTRNAYNYACFTNRAGNSARAMNLLFETSAGYDFDKYRQLAAKDSDLSSLRSNAKFKRFLAGYRRLKITPLEGYSKDDDGMFGIEPYNDLFAVVSHNGKILLATTPGTDRNTERWSGEYVTFDYKLGSPVGIYLVDEDVYDHDWLVGSKGALVSTGDLTFNGNGYLKVRIEDTESDPRTTGVDIPEERGLFDDLLAGAGAYAIMKAAIEGDHSFASRLVNCSVEAGIGQFVDNPVQAALVEDAYKSVVEKRGPSVKNIAVSTLQGYLVQELQNTGHRDAAALIQKASYVGCLLSK